MKEDGKEKLCIYKLNSGTAYTLENGKTEAAVWNDQIFVCDENGNAELRSLNDPLIVTKEFKLPYTLRSTLAYLPRVIPVGKNLAFVTSEKTVVLIDKDSRRSRRSLRRRKKRPESKSKSLPLLMPCA